MFPHYVPSCPKCVLCLPIMSLAFSFYVSMFLYYSDYLALFSLLLPDYVRIMSPWFPSCQPLSTNHVLTISSFFSYSFPMVSLLFPRCYPMTSCLVPPLFGCCKVNMLSNLQQVVIIGSKKVRLSFFFPTLLRPSSANPMVPGMISTTLILHYKSQWISINHNES